MKRVVYTNGHALMPTQPSPELYQASLCEDVRRIAGDVVAVHDVTTASLSNDSPGTLTLTLENVCGNFRSYAHEVPFAGGLMQQDAPHVGRFVEGRKFVGTHMLFHTLYGRLQYTVGSKTWMFKGTRSLDDMVAFVRELSQDPESPMFPCVTMFSATLHTGASIVIEPSRSLFWRVVQRLFSDVVLIQPRADDITNLFFMKVLNWEKLVRVVVEDPKPIPGHGLEEAESDARMIRAYLEDSDTQRNQQPTGSIGFTRRGVFFLRFTFPSGCICEVAHSRGHTSVHTDPDTVPIAVPGNISVGGVEPCMNTTARFVMLLLYKMCAVV